jgi:pilus assembly protein Flp/PilA
LKDVLLSRTEGVDGSLIQGIPSGNWAGPELERVFPPRWRFVTMTTLFNKLVRDEAGQDLIEYGLLLGLITIGAILVISSIGGKISGLFEKVNTNLDQVS